MYAHANIIAKISVLRTILLKYQKESLYFQDVSPVILMILRVDCVHTNLRLLIKIVIEQGLAIDVCQVNT